MTVPAFSPLEALTCQDIIANATAEKLDTGHTVAVYGVEADNTNNSAASYVKLWFQATSPTVGTDAPDMILPAPAGEIFRQPLPMTKAAAGFSTEADAYVYAACVTTPGTAGTTSPTNDVKVTFKTSAGT